MLFSKQPRGGNVMYVTGKQSHVKDIPRWDFVELVVVSDVFTPVFAHVSISCVRKPYFVSHRSVWDTTIFIFRISYLISLFCFISSQRCFFIFFPIHFMKTFFHKKVNLWKYIFFYFIGETSMLCHETWNMSCLLLHSQAMPIHLLAPSDTVKNKT